MEWEQDEALERAVRKSGRGAWRRSTRPGQRAGGWRTASPSGARSTASVLVWSGRRGSAADPGCRAGGERLRAGGRHSLPSSVGSSYSGSFSSTTPSVRAIDLSGTRRSTSLLSIRFGRSRWASGRRLRTAAFNAVLLTGWRTSGGLAECRLVLPLTVSTCAATSTVAWRSCRCVAAAVAVPVFRYRELRASTVGTRPVFAVAELGTGVLTLKDALAPDFVELRRRAALLTAWVNDLYSYPKEHAAGDPLNLVQAIAHRDRLPPQEAIDRVVRLYNDELRQFEALAHAASRAGGSAGRRRYVVGVLRHWVHANRWWTQHCGRYLSEDARASRRHGSGMTSFVRAVSGARR